MNAVQLLHYASRNGLAIKPAGDKLKVSGNRHAANADFLADLKAHKAELLALLASNDAESDTVRAIVTFRLSDGPDKGGVLIDPDGIASAVRDLIDRYGARLDLGDLLQQVERIALAEHTAMRQAERQALDEARQAIGRAAARC